MTECDGVVDSVCVVEPVPESDPVFDELAPEVSDAVGVLDTERVRLLEVLGVVDGVAESELVGEFVGVALAVAESEARGACEPASGSLCDGEGEGV